MWMQRRLLTGKRSLLSLALDFDKMRGFVCSRNRDVVSFGQSADVSKLVALFAGVRRDSGNLPALGLEV